MKKIFFVVLGYLINLQSCLWATLDDFFWANKPKHLVELTSSWDWKDAVLILIAQVIDLILYFAWTIAVWFIIYWWFRMITDFWTDSWVSEWKKIVYHAIIWLLVIFISIILVENTERFVRFIMWDASL